jgi:hypothetical protein
MDNKLLEYCRTDKQREAIKAHFTYASQTEAAKSIGMDISNFSKSVKRTKARAAKHGYAPDHNMIHEAAPGFAVKGTSTLYDMEGNAKLQWVKTSQDAEQMQEAMDAAMQGFKDELPKAFAIPESRIDYNSDILNQYTLTDSHLGALSWKPETGSSWDLDIAERTILGWFEQAIKSAPNAESCMFANLADYLHYDSMESVTPTNNHILDSDSRFQKVVRTAIRITRKIISMLLGKYKAVNIVHCAANHDPASGVWLREWLVAHYEDEPRIIVDDSADIYYCHKFGNVSLFYHHGHVRRLANIDDVFVAKFREIYGSTKYSYAHLGHLHSRAVKSTNLMILEQHETLAAPDAYASNGGWMSDRSAQVITYHKEYGECGRVRITPAMVLPAEDL